MKLRRDERGGKENKTRKGGGAENIHTQYHHGAFAAVICMQIISRIGITPNTSIIGAIVAMALARIPFASMVKFRSLERQNLVQTMTSAGGFGAANCGILAVGIIYLYGEPRLLIPMLIGSAISTLVGMNFVYSVFDSDLYPGEGAWPPGVACSSHCTR